MIMENGTVFNSVTENSKIYILPVIYVNSERANVVAIHVVPKCQTVSSSGRLEDITDQERSVSQFAH